MGSQYGKVKDQNVIDYFNTANITNLTARRQIYDFVKEIKKLGIWNNFICWMLVNTQQGKQSGTTSGTIYSLGGLGTYNATMTNSPVIGTDGVTSTGLDQGYLVASTGADLLAINPVTSGSVYKSSNTSWFSQNYWLYGNQYGQTTNQSSGGWFREAISVGLLNQMRGETLVNSLNTSNDQTSFCFFTNTTSSAASNNSLNYKNGSLSTTQTVGTTVSPVPIGSNSYQFACAQGAGAYSGTSAFHFVIRNIFLSASEILSFYNIYKNTIGSTIGLP